jgi:hypothetical protein
MDAADFAVGFAFPADGLMPPARRKKPMIVGNGDYRYRVTVAARHSEPDDRRLSQGLVAVTNREAIGLPARSNFKRPRPQLAIAPLLGSKGLQGSSGGKAAWKVEVVVDGGADTEKALRRPDRFGPLRLGLSSSHRLM